MNSNVTIVACRVYEEKEVLAAVGQAFELLGGLERFVRPGAKVLLKPNLLSARAPQEGVTTHPLIVKAVIGEVQKCGGTALVGDSPGGLSADNVFEKVVVSSGIEQICLATGAQLVNLGKNLAEVKNPEGRLFKRFTLSAVLQDVDVVINLPKLKTHQFMTLTAGVKNLFGLVPGLQKAEFHLKVPERSGFADMLVDLYLAVKPQVTLVDGVEAMEGAGPSAGAMRPLGLIIAGNDALAVDLIISEIVGFKLREVPTNRVAFDRGLAKEDLSHIAVNGLPVNSVMVRDFRRPEGAIQDRVPKVLVTVARDLATPKPVVERDICNGCAICEESCPVKAIKMIGTYPELDYKTCIRCYCCQELCSQSAIKLKTSWLARFFAHH